MIAASNYCDEHKYSQPDSNHIISYHPQLCTYLVQKNYRISFDLIVKIGRMRYDEHRQLREIQHFLSCSYARIDLSISTIAMITKRFLLLCQLLHKKYRSRIVEDIEFNGGYFLHFDGSTENKCDAYNLVIMDSLSGHVLESIMIKNETYVLVAEALQRVRELYGFPLATISDLKNGFLRACKDVFGEDTPHIFCHYHFLKTYKDYFTPYHQLIKSYLCSKIKLKPSLVALLKTVNENLSDSPKLNLHSLESIERYWTKTLDTLNCYRLVLQWILNYKHDSCAKGVPFDLMYLDFYNRFIKGKKLIQKIFNKRKDSYYMKYYKRGFCIVADKLKKTSKETQKFFQAIEQLEFQKKLFQQLRATLYLEAQEDSKHKSLLAPLSQQYNLTKQQANTIPKRLTEYIQALNEQAEKCTEAIKKSIIIKFKEKVEKYQHNLLVPIIQTQNVVGHIQSVVAPRTNNCMERFFRLIKTQMRRCVGRARLSKEFASIGALLPYYFSIKQQKAFSDICNDDEKLCHEFAKLFQADKNDFNVNSEFLNTMNCDSNEKVLQSL